MRISSTRSQRSRSTSASKSSAIRTCSGGCVRARFSRRLRRSKHGGRRRMVTTGQASMKSCGDGPKKKRFSCVPLRQPGLLRLLRRAWLFRKDRPPRSRRRRLCLSSRLLFRRLHRLWSSRPPGLSPSRLQSLRFPFNRLFRRLRKFRSRRQLSLSPRAPRTPPRWSWASPRPHLVCRSRCDLSLRMLSRLCAGRRRPHRPRCCPSSRRPLSPAQLRSMSATTTPFFRRWRRRLPTRPRLRLSKAHWRPRRSSTRSSRPSPF